MAIHRRGRTVGLIGLALLAGSLGCAGTPTAGHAADPPRVACGDAVPDIYDRISPAVVFISATTINPYRLSERITRVVGSGVIVDPSGLILTNAHVAYARQAIRVTLDDGTGLPAELVGADPIFDLAVLRVRGRSTDPLPTAPLGDSDQLRVGDEVLALGNPLGLDQTLTKGIVSAINRLLPDTPFSLSEPLIQTDAPINPGNSGGPLLDRCGKVVGINTATIPDAQGIGFAIPINLVRMVMPELLIKGHLVRPWVGFHGQLLPDDVLTLFRVPLVPGLAIEVLEPGGPAEKIGLQGGRLEVAVGGRDYLLGGDIVTEINGATVAEPEKLEEAMRKLKVGDILRLKVFRDGESRVVEYELPERPILPGDLATSRTLSPLRRSLRPRP